MSKAEIVEQLPRLTREEREEIRLKLAELDGTGWSDDEAPLSEADKSLIESRVQAHENNPGTAIPWEQFEDQLKRRTGR